MTIIEVRKKIKSICLELGHPKSTLDMCNPVEQIDYCIKKLFILKEVDSERANFIREQYLYLMEHFRLKFDE